MIDNVRYLPKSIDSVFLDHNWSVVMMCIHNDITFVVNRNYTFFDNMVKSDECEFWEIGESFFPLSESNVKILEYVNVSNFNREDQKFLNNIKKQWRTTLENNGNRVGYCLDACIDDEINKTITKDFKSFRVRMRKRYDEIKKDYNKLLKETNENLLNIRRCDFVLNDYFNKLLDCKRVNMPNQNKFIGQWNEYYPLFLVERDELKEFSKLNKSLLINKRNKYCELFFKENPQYYIFDKNYLNEIIK